MADVKGVGIEIDQNASIRERLRIHKRVVMPQTGPIVGPMKATMSNFKSNTDVLAMFLARMRVHGKKKAPSVTKICAELAIPHSRQGTQADALALHTETWDLKRMLVRLRMLTAKFNYRPVKDAVILS